MRGLRSSHSACPAAPGPQFSEHTNTRVPWDHPAPPGSIWSSLSISRRLESPVRLNSRPEFLPRPLVPRAFRRTVHLSRHAHPFLRKRSPSVHDLALTLFLVHPSVLLSAPTASAHLPPTPASGPLPSPASAQRHKSLQTPHRTPPRVTLIPRSP